ncbi:MAG: polysaccharide ABC transporter [Ruminococcaceae bacterium]|nr:polysaccharide ABC transporter [Oscillospiraceae bacterium]
MLNRAIQDLKKYFRYSVVSAKSKLKAEVANSYLNWLWWILDPLCFMLIYTFIFGFVFDAKEQHFPVFIFIGLTMWDFVNKTLLGSVKTIKLNKAIVSRVYFPKFILVLSKIWINGFKMMISFGVVVLLMIISKVHLSLNVLFFIPILLILVLFTFGCSCIVMHYGVYVEDLSNVLNIFMRFVFYATGIFYNIETRIPQFGGLLNKINPVAFLITSMRQCLIYGSTPDWKLLLLWFTVSVILVILGLRKIYKEENSYVKAI